MPARLKPQISTRQEELLWERKILSLQCSSGLIQAVIFYLIKSCGVFQGRDLRQLKTEHVNFGEDSVGSYVTIDFTSVMRSGKVVRHYDDPNNPRSLYKLLKTYISHLANEGAFLVRPISSIKDYICYSPWPLGVAIIEHMVQTLMEEAGQGSRYGNISASLLALDVLKSYGAGRHCLSTWVDCLGGAAVSYRLKVLSGKIPDCSAINCRDLNAEAGLIMSHLLDPPYPSGPTATQGEVKTDVDESDPQNSESTGSDESAGDTSSSREHQPGSKSRSTVNRDRLRFMKRAGVGLAQARRIATGTGLNLHKKQARFSRLKSRDSLKAGLDSRTNNKVSLEASAPVKMELQEEDEEAALVELDIAGLDCHGEAEDLGQVSGDGGDDETVDVNGTSSLTGKRTAEAEDEDDDAGSSIGGKVPKIEQHFQELEATMCGHLATFEDGAGQREDITGDSSGEISEECQTGIHNGANTNSHFLASVDSAVNANTDTSSSEKPCEVISSAEENRLEAQSPQKRENLSLVSGLEQWLDQLKHQVNTGLDSDMNRLFLQATSQLKVIADKVMAGKVEKGADSRTSHQTVSSTVSSKSQSPVKPTSSGGARYGSTTSVNSDSSVKAQLMRQLENVQNHRLSPRQETASVSAQESLRTDLNSTYRQSTKPAETERCKVDLDKRKVGDTLNPGLEDLKPGPSLGRMDDSGEESLPSVELSPPVLSPQPPTEEDNGHTSFLYSSLPPRHHREHQSPEPCGKDDPPLIDTPQAQAPVPDLVKFLESANLQMQSLLSQPQGGNSKPHSAEVSAVRSKSNRLSDLPAKSKNIHETHLKSSPLKPRPGSVSGKAKLASPGEISQQTPEAARNQAAASWPVLRSVLEEALLPPALASGKDGGTSLPDKINCNNRSSSINNCDISSSTSRVTNFKRNVNSIDNFISTNSINNFNNSSSINNFISNTSSSINTSTTLEPRSSSSIPPLAPAQQPSPPDLAAQSGMYTFQSDHRAGAAFQSLTVVSGNRRSEVFTFPDLPLDKHNATLTPTDGNSGMRLGAASSRAVDVRNARSELCLGDYLPRGSVVPASSIKVLTQQGRNGLEVVLRFDFSRKDRDNV